MADRNSETPWHHFATAVLLILFAVSVVTLLRMPFGPVSDSEWMSALIGLLIAVAAFFAGYRGRLDDSWSVGEGYPVAKLVKVERPQKEGLFLFRASLLLTAYVGFFFVSARMAQANLGQSDFPPAYIVVGIIAAVTMGAFSWFSVCYARHNRRSSLLKGGLDECFTASVTQEQRRSLVGHLYNEVSKDDHIFEPPGNIFVTMGIMATFLGLAIGLVTLDLSAMLRPEGGDTAARAALQSFMACIGLALGSSMVGVLMALFAQVLRGHGPSECSEDLLRRTEINLREGS